ncbi:MAG: 50S ribosomal protein L24 [Chitinispirillaceae bacterium]
MAFRIRRDDTVLVIAGEHKGMTGKIVRLMPKKNRAIVEGVNVVKRHTKPNPKNQQGGIVEKEASIHMSNLMLVCPKTQEPTRVGVKTLENGKRVRYSKKAKELID